MHGACPSHDVLTAHLMILGMRGAPPVLTITVPWAYPPLEIHTHISPPPHKRSLSPSPRALTGRHVARVQDVCKRAGRRCAQEAFPQVNKCSVLKGLFPCKVCDPGGSGDAQPAYVPTSNPREKAGSCLVMIGAAMTCDARSNSQQRACPCM